MKPEEILVNVPSGSFDFLQCPPDYHPSYRQMSLGRPCRIHLSRPFRMAKVPVDRKWWFSVMKTTPWKRHITDKKNRCVPDNDNCPVIGVTWNDAMEFCSKLSLEWGRNVMLPTEAQWVHACKAGSTTVFPWGENSDKSKFNAEAKKYACFNSALEFEAELRPAGERLPNAWGLHDMLGLVSEWVRDEYCVDDANQIYNAHLTEEMTDPIFTDGPRRVLKGGAFCFGLLSACDLSRPHRLPDVDEFLNGFRIIEELP